MTARVRLLATDLDGTLLRSDGTVDDVTRAALARARAAGLAVVFVTGRPPRWLHEVAESADHFGLSIGGNGAVVYDLSTERVVASDPLDPGVVVDVTDALREAFPGIAFGLEYGLEFGHEPEYRHDWEITPVADRRGRVMPTPTVATLAELCVRPVLKILAKWRDAPDVTAFTRQATTLLAGVATVTRSSTGPLLEISAHGITKATGMSRLADHLGVRADQTAAVGDMPNDLAMLAWAGHGYAVANAHPDVRAVADHVLAETNDDHAVAHLIDRLLAGAR